MARTFDGVDDKGVATVNTKTTSAWTIAFWVKPGATGNTFGRVVNARTTAPAEHIAAFTDGTLGKIKALMVNSAGSITYGPSPTTMPTDGSAWYWWVSRWTNGGAINTRIYNVDGTLFSDVSGSAVTLTLNDQTGGTVNVGHSGGGSPFGGVVARVFIHNERLTDAQLDALRDGTMPVTPSADYWSMADNAADETGDIHGTLLTITGAVQSSDAGLPNASPTVSPLLAKDFADDFPGTALDPAKWDTPPTPVTVNEEVIIQQLDWYPGAFQKGTLDMMNSQVHVAVRPDTNIAGSSREDGIQLQYNNDAHNRAMILHSADGIRGRVFIDNVITNTPTITYDPVQHLYRRIRYVDGQGFYFDVAPAAGGPWTAISTTPLDVPWNVRDLELALFAGFWKAGETTDKVVRFDKLNVTAATMTLTGQVAATGTASKLGLQTWAGSIAAAGTAELMRVVFLALAGTVAAAGALGKLVPLVRAGAVALAGGAKGDGTFRLDVFATKDGSVTPEGTKMPNVVQVTHGGTVTPGSDIVRSFLGRVFGRAGIVVLTVRALGRVRLRVRRPN